MKKKYILEIPADEVVKYSGAGCLFIPYEIAGKCGYIDTGLVMTPYTEPDASEAYQKGLSDAWEAARKIWENDIDTLHKIFGWVPMRMDVFLKFTAAEVIEKLKAYEQEQKEQIQVGDEVLVDDDIKGVVLDIDEYIIHVFDENGLVMAGDKELMTKTGRQFPEIAEVLKKMRKN